VATDGTIVPPLYNREVDSLVQGELVRISGTNGVVRAQADSSGHVLGYEGVVESGKIGPNGPVVVRSVGRQRVLLVAGLTPAAGDLVYVSAVTAGRGTTVAPGIPVPVGTIVDASKYTTDSSVSMLLPAIGTASGAQGAQGGPGAQGAQGSTGGAQGAQGASGAQGSAGAQGGSGAQGAQGAGGTTLAAIYQFGLVDNPTVDNKLVGSYFTTYFGTDASIKIAQITADGANTSNPALILQRAHSLNTVSPFIYQQNIIQNTDLSTNHPDDGLYEAWQILNAYSDPLQTIEIIQHFRFTSALGPEWIPGYAVASQDNFQHWDEPNRFGTNTQFVWNSDGVHFRHLLFPDGTPRVVLHEQRSFIGSGTGAAPPDGSTSRAVWGGPGVALNGNTPIVAYDVVLDAQNFAGGDAAGHFDFLTSTIADGLNSTMLIAPGLITIREFGTTGVAALEFEDGASSPVSLAGTAALRYNAGTDKIQYSKNTGAWTDLV
jgi:hypothetical protein